MREKKAGDDMNKRFIDWTDYANDIVKANPKGILLTTKANGQVDTMTIGWGTIGTNWEVPVFCAYIREHRHTVELLRANPEFTVNVPVGEYDKRIIGICGSRRGDEHDKIAEAGLTLVEPEVVGVPGIAELPLTLECQVIYTQAQDKAAYPAEFARLYPQDVDGRATGANRDAHISVWGRIVSAYIIEK